jgi:hypothetical protein
MWRVEEAFAIVLFVVVGVAVVAAVWALATSRGSYDQIGRGAMSIGDDAPPRPRAGAGGPTSPAEAAEREAEIRQMLQAKSDRLEDRGEAPLDVEAEYRALTAPVVDASLRDEVRSLVVARNERRMARGEEPLDVEAEVERKLRELT